jgi:hypothetical protein
MKFNSLVEIYNCFNLNAIVDDDMDSIEDSSGGYQKGIEGEESIACNLKASDIILFHEESDRKVKTEDFLSELQEAKWFKNAIESYLIDHFFRCSNRSSPFSSLYSDIDQTFQHEILEEGGNEWIPATRTLSISYKGQLHYEFVPRSAIDMFGGERHSEKPQRLAVSSLNGIRQALGVS